MGKSKPIKCNHCDNPATYHLTQIVENQLHKIDLCEDCANSQGLANPDTLDIDALIGKAKSQGTSMDEPLLDDVEEGAALVCALSGASFQDFKKTGRLGSAECYTLFRDKLMPILKNMHRGTAHVGKAPSSITQEENPLVALRRELAVAVSEECFEEAARLRDLINREEAGEGVNA